MTVKEYSYVACNGCFTEQRMEEPGAMFRGDRTPDGWVRVTAHDGTDLWDLCPACHKEVAVLLFDSKRIDRVLAERRAAEAR